LHHTADLLWPAWGWHIAQEFLGPFSTRQLALQRIKVNVLDNLCLGRTTLGQLLAG